MASSQRVVIIGVAPTEERQHPFSPITSSGRRLIELSGCRSYVELRQRFKLENLCHSPMRAVGTLTAQQRHVLSLLADAYHLDPECRYILCGSEVLRAFGERVYPAGGRRFAERTPFEWWWSRNGLYNMAYMMHTSGRNRFYNSRENCARASEFLKEAMRVDDAGEYQGV